MTLYAKRFTVLNISSPIYSCWHLQTFFFHTTLCSKYIPCDCSCFRRFVWTQEDIKYMPLLDLEEFQMNESMYDNRL